MKNPKNGGEDATQYVVAKEGLQEKLSAVLSDEKAGEQASDWTGMAIKDYQIVKENGGFYGDFEEFANQFFALNRLRIKNYAQMREEEAESGLWKKWGFQTAIDRYLTGYLKKADTRLTR